MIILQPKIFPGISIGKRGTSETKKASPASVIKEKKAEAKRIMTYSRYEKCESIIRKASIIPSAGERVQIKMATELGWVFGLDISTAEAKSRIAEIRSGIDLIPMGMMAVAVIPPMSGGIVTEAIGWALAVDFATA